jgi:hypothetical protein
MWKPKVEDFMRMLRRMFGEPGNDVATLQDQLMRERRSHAENMFLWEQERETMLRELLQASAKLALRDAGEAPPSPPSPSPMIH